MVLPNRHGALIALRFGHIEEQIVKIVHQKTLISEMFGRRESLLAFCKCLITSTYLIEA